MATNYTVTVDITKDSSGDAMVAALIGLKAGQLQGIIDPQRFRVNAMHIRWCSQQAGIGDAVARRVDEAVKDIKAGGGASDGGVLA